MPSSAAVACWVTDGESTLRSGINLSNQGHLLDTLRRVKNVLVVDGRRRTGWFLAAKRSLEPVISDRSRLVAVYMANPSSAEKEDTARGARKVAQRVVEAAQSSWVDSVLAVMNADGTVNNADGKPISPQAAWHAIRVLRRGPR
jgi:hypothetical protein